MIHPSKMPTATLRAILALAIASTITLTPLFADCLTQDCCWRDFKEHLHDCDELFPSTQDPAQQQIRNYGIQTCYDGAGVALVTCLDCVKIGCGEEDPPDPPPVSFALNGGKAIYTDAAVGSDPTTFTYNVYVLPQLAGSFEIWVANGTPDSGSTAGISRAVGTIKINGVVVVNSTALSASSDGVSVPVTLSTGQNTIEVSINKAVQPAQNPDETDFGMILVQFVK